MLCSKLIFIFYFILLIHQNLCLKYFTISGPLFIFREKKIEKLPECIQDGSCPQKVVFEVACKFDSDCCRNAYCDRPNLSAGGVCKCLENYILQTNKTHMDCLYTPKYMGESCEKDVQCQVSFGNNAICSESHCKCSPNTHFENGVCYRNGKIGDMCDTNADCYIEDALTFCVNSVCVCNTYYHPIDGGTKCVKSKRLEDKCESDSECTLENTRCLGACRCQIHYVANKQRTTCLKVVDNFEDFCEEDAQCSQFLDNGACVNNKCGCSNGYHLYSNKCWKNVDLFEICENENECKIDSKLDGIVECIDERCACKYGIHPNRTCFHANYSKDNSDSSSGQTVFINFYNLFLMLFVYILLLN